MNLRCFFGHKYSHVATQATEIFRTGLELPVAFETTFLFQCIRCKEVKTEIVNGYFPRKDDDDDGGGDEKPPILSPDDFYESIGK